MEITRSKNNPLITKEDVPFRVNSIFNPGAVKINDTYLLLCRVELPTGRSSLVIAESRNGYDFKINDELFLTPDHHTKCYKYVEWGIEDARITPIDGKYFITYTGYSKYMPLIVLAETSDFKDVKIHGPISESSNKDCSLFPEKINGYYWKVDRPSAEHRKDIWINRSPDLIHWGRHQVLMNPEEGSWEQDKIGASSNPVKTDKGWLMLYHGVRGFGITSIYKLGVLLLDLNEPWKVIGKSKEPILSPDEEYERIGDVNNVVFSTGWIFEDNGNVKIYYSGADMNICLAETTVEDLLSVCK
ncbi:MAG: glycoside hydrolase family 130 protein [Melioribacteraceae bacterium]|nr:glycoside hydrolase family 130 protein [Melioribacteraceae bacterium]MCF8353261.1 glycoside hydrolase family 130 protein [Melioribacteraceae bacterium]MCF8395575.1 glycoside hydrolase family 130 protein [Melioribacteraceae bacterium]MCF8418788.1 glycoside hydrolase family 130 protein [Melioribacteraceae bacterium]